jgi:DNA-directed RNA polymerase specialized sigma24 family protein
LIADKLAPAIAPGIPGAAHEQITLPGHSALVSALRILPPRQREVLVLRYYANLSDAQIATTMGISTGAVKSHIEPPRVHWRLRCFGLGNDYSVVFAG